MANTLTFTYRNHRGETAERTVVPGRMWYGSTHWHPQPQWFLRAWDTDKSADRDFAWDDIT